MNNHRSNVLAHLALVVVGTLTLLAVSRPADAVTLTVAVMGVSSGALTLQIMWAELRRSV
jgi:hypothetical protein